MPRCKPLPSQEYLKSILDYDPETGAFTWKHRPNGPRHWNTKYAGTRAGSLEPVSGYERISINDRIFKAHRLAWVWMTGDSPDEEIDHINGDRLDNRWANLRLATHGQNQANCKTWNKFGLKGVTKCGNRFLAKITKNHEYHYLGLFATPEEAHAAYMKAAREMHGEFARG